MRLLAEWTVRHGGAERKIELLHGSLAHLPPDHAVDVLVVSAFKGDYTPTETSLVGALHRVGLSILKLSTDKQADLRQQYSCWLSKPVQPHFNFRRVLCIESGWRGTPLQTTDDVFLALTPFLLTEFPNISMAMPLIGAGDQNFPPEQMLQAILHSAVGWMERGLPLRLLKIAVRKEEVARRAAEVFASCKSQHEGASDQPASSAATPPRGGQDAGAPSASGKSARPDEGCDIFLSYAHEDGEFAEYLAEKLQEAPQSVKVFHDRSSLTEGSAWLMEIAEALDSARRVVALYSAGYWASINCKMEFSAALARQNDTGEKILFPIYLSDAKIPYMFRNLQHSDCRVNDKGKLSEACVRIAKSLH